MAGFAVLSVSQLNQYIKSVFESDQGLDSVYLRGEISNFTNHYSSGHLYFTLKDAGAAIKAVMFKGAAAYLKFKPENGMSVTVQGRVSVYPRDGVYQIYVNDMQPDGAGALAVAFEQLKRRLAEEGVFDEEHKKPIPQYPAKIGIITSRTGAVIQDICNVLKRRFPAVEAELYPVQVQGIEAHKQIIAAIKQADAQKSCDVIIIARGGGSVEDLWCFNEESLARAIYACETPIISAVGHETDFTIADFAADLRAPTPTAAAELVVADSEELLYRIASLSLAMRISVEARIRECRNTLEKFSDKQRQNIVEQYISQNLRRVKELSGIIEREKDICFARAREQLRAATLLLDSVSPTRQLLNGYAAVTKDNSRITCAANLKIGDAVKLQFADGSVCAQITEDFPNKKGD